MKRTSAKTGKSGENRNKKARSESGYESSKEDEGFLDPYAIFVECSKEMCSPKGA